MILFPESQNCISAQNRAGVTSIVLYLHLRILYPHKFQRLKEMAAPADLMMT